MKVLHIFTSDKGKYYSEKLRGVANDPKASDEFHDQVECHNGKGIVGDRFYGHKEDFKGQVTFLSFEKHLELEKALGKSIEIKSYRRNFIVSGKDPLELVGHRFKIGEVEFEGIEDCSPCKFMDQYVGQGALKWMREHQSGGLRAKVLSDGVVKVGDTLNSLEEPFYNGSEKCS